MGGTLIPRAMQFEHLHELQKRLCPPVALYHEPAHFRPPSVPQKLSRFLCGRCWTASLAGCQYGTGHQFIARPGEVLRWGAPRSTRAREQEMSAFQILTFARRTNRELLILTMYVLTSSRYLACKRRAVLGADPAAELGSLPI
jgi:hypothetical protein